MWKHILNISTVVSGKQQIRGVIKSNLNDRIIHSVLVPEDMEDRVRSEKNVSNK